MSESDTPKAASAKDCPLQQVLKLATKTAEGHLGTQSGNKRVSATAALATEVTENGTTSNDSVHATVSLGVSHSEGKAKAECCCKQHGLPASGCCCAQGASDTK